MADDVTVHNGATGDGTAFDVATDDDGSGNHVQLVKLVQSANGARTPIDADTDGLEVKVTNASLAVTGSLAASSVDVARIQVTPTISTGIYAAKDNVGGLMTFANAAAAGDDPIRVNAVHLVDKDQEMASFDLLLFRASITAPTDNAAFDPTDAELADYIGHIPIYAAHYADLNDNAVAVAPNPDRAWVTLAGTSLYGVLVSRGTPTYTSTSDLVVTLFVERG